LYEYYVLLKILNGILAASDKCTLFGHKRHKYVMPPKSLYRNTTFDNTFYFEYFGKKITVYYQPVVYGQDYSKKEDKSNGIGVYRCTTFKFSSSLNEDEDSIGQHLYYTPDYIIKTETDSGNRYMILDAKYSDPNMVRRQYFSALVFKYLFSIGVVEPNDSITGLYVLCGRHCIDGQPINAYDITNGLEFINYKQEALLIPLLESESTSVHKEIISRCLMCK
jgi:hypothetical protein